MTLSTPSFLAAATSAAIPPPSAADLAAAQSPGLADGDAAAGEAVPEGAPDALGGESSPCAAGAREDEQPAALAASAAIPATSLRDNLTNYLASIPRPNGAHALVVVMRRPARA